MSEAFWKPVLSNNTCSQDLNRSITQTTSRYIRKPGKAGCSSCPQQSNNLGHVRFLGGAHRFLFVGHGSTLGRNFFYEKLGTRRACYSGHKNYIDKKIKPFFEIEECLTAMQIITLTENEVEVATDSRISNGFADSVNKLNMNPELTAATEQVENDGILVESPKNNTIDENNNNQSMTVANQSACEINQKAPLPEANIDVKEINARYKKDMLARKEQALYKGRNNSRRYADIKNTVIVRNKPFASSNDQISTEKLIDPLDWQWTPLEWKVTRAMNREISSNNTSMEYWGNYEKEEVTYEQTLQFEDAE